MTSNNAPKYTLASKEFSTTSSKSKKARHRRGSSKGNSDSEDADPTDGSGSLTYSAASSVHSGGSAAGESTDSSFADIMRVLDLQDSKELAALIKKEGVSSAGELREKRGFPASGVSVASSLNYSTDGESALEGSKLLQTIAGQPSDGYGFDGGSSHGRHMEEQTIQGDSNIMFAPAEPDDYIKRKKDRKRNKEKNPNDTPRAKNSSKNFADDAHSPSSKSRTTPTKGGRSPADSSRSATPPPLPPKGMIEEDEDIWYAKWWMSCFPDSFKNMMPKR